MKNLFYIKDSLSIGNFPKEITFLFFFLEKTENEIINERDNMIFFHELLVMFFNLNTNQIAKSLYIMLMKKNKLDIDKLIKFVSKFD